MSPDPRICPHVWLHTSSQRTPVLGNSTCTACGKTADSFDIRIWRAMNRLRQSWERRAEKGKL